MEQNVFKIKKAFLLPFIAIIILLFVLLILNLLNGQPWEKIILAVAFAVTLLVGIEAANRHITASNEGMKVKKFSRVKTLTWPDVTHLGVVALLNKAYFLLTTTKGFYFFSNMYENHALLIQSIVDKLEAERVEMEVRNYLEHPRERRSLIVICWITALIISAFIVLKLLSF